MAQKKSPEAVDARERAALLEAERRERRTQLMLRRSKLSDDEAVILREEVFPEIFAEHQTKVWNRLRRRGLHRPGLFELDPGERARR